VLSGSKREGTWLQHVTEVEKPGYEVSNPVTLAATFRELSQSGNTKDKLLADVMAEMQVLRSEVADLRSQAYIRAIAGPGGILGVGTTGPYTTATGSGGLLGVRLTWTSR
jgi:hypothetical protein